MEDLSPPSKMPQFPSMEEEDLAWNLLPTLYVSHWVEHSLMARQVNQLAINQDWVVRGPWTSSVWWVVEGLSVSASRDQSEIQSPRFLWDWWGQIFWAWIPPKSAWFKLNQWIWCSFEELLGVTLDGMFAIESALRTPFNYLICHPFPSAPSSMSIAGLVMSFYGTQPYQSSVSSLVLCPF